MAGRRRVWIWAAWSLAAVVLVLLAFAAGYRELALPVDSGRLRVQGLPKGVPEVEIERDRNGIPTIRAGSAEGAWFGLGFAHAQDRLWQMETHRRIGAGRLAEAFGPAAVDNDRFLRALGVRQAAAGQWEKTQGEGRQALLAYTAGVNAYLSDHLRARPPEFLLLGLRPQQWDPVDSLAWMIMMAWDLGGNWTSELLRLRLAERLDNDRLWQLLPPYPGDKPLTAVDLPQRVREWQVSSDLVDKVMAAAPESGVEGVGSNNWVVSGARSQTGKPLLANDPHLKLSAPALWYFARLEAPGLKVAGTTLPGLPLVVLGQNEQVAWGFTNTGPDVQDLYLERLHPDDPERYETPGGGWARFETREEVIQVRGAAPVTLQVRRSRHGPVISDAGLPITSGLDGRKGGPRYAIAMRWTALEPDPGSLVAGLRFNRARSVEEFMAAAESHTAPMQNIVVADALGEQGHIGFVAPGRIPLRREDNDLRGLLPAPGWEARYDWAGWLDPQVTPRERDPQRGWIATANQKVVPDDYPHFLTSEWTLPYRQQRIEQLLQARPKHDLDSLAAIQRDDLSLAALPLLPWFRAAAAGDPTVAGLAEAIKRFEGRMSGEDPVAALFQAWVRALTEAVLADDLGPLWNSQFSERRQFRDALEGVLARQDSRWCDLQTTSQREDCDQITRQAFQTAVTQLQQRLGPDPRSWRWDELHLARSEHRPFSKVPALARWFEVRVPTAGDSYSVNATRVSLRALPGDADNYLSDHGPSLRALYDLKDPAKSRVIQSTGQSGLPFSPHYRDMARNWAQVRYVPLWAAPGPGRSLTLAPR